MRTTYYDKDGNIIGTCIAEYDEDGNLVRQMTLGIDPPIYQNIMVFPTLEHFLGSDLNKDGDTSDTILCYQNLETGEIINTGLVVSSAYHAIDIYKNIIAFVGENSCIQYYDIDTSTVRETGAIGFYPSIYESIIVFASEGNIKYFDIHTQTLVSTGILGNNPAIYQDMIVFHAGSEPMIWIYDLRTQTSTNTKIIGMNAAFYETIVAFETPEFSVLEDLNGDGDTDDCVIRYYDLETQIITNTGIVGIFLALYEDQIVFTVPEGDVNIDLNGDGRILGNVICHIDTRNSEVVNTRKLGSEPDIFGNTITFYVQENWIYRDFNEDGDFNSRSESPW